MTKTDKRIGVSQCWCGREWAVDSLKDQCLRGDHMKPREVNRGT